MAEFDRNVAQSQNSGARADIDQGLRAHMLRIYNYMTGGVALTGIVAFIVSQMVVTGNGQLTALGAAIYTSPLQWVVMLAPLAMVFAISFGVHKFSFATQQIMFWIFAALMGLSLSSIFLVFTGESIVQVFFISAASFGALSLWGYTTKRDISGWGSFLFMGLIGIILAAIVNIFLQSGALGFAINVIGVLVFAGLTAYDTQRLKTEYYAGAGTQLLGKMAIQGALSLYLNFINLFMMLLSLLGNRE